MIAPPTILLAGDEGDPHVPVGGFRPQAVEGVVQAEHRIPVFGNAQVSFQQELQRSF